MASGHHGNSVLLIFFFVLETSQAVVLLSNECFCHFHGGRILYLCSCTIFFPERESVMYESKYQSHWSKVRNLSDAKQYPM